eukprot:1077149-Rhodomonas_salina.1
MSGTDIAYGAPGVVYGAMSCAVTSGVWDIGPHHQPFARMTLGALSYPPMHLLRPVRVWYWHRLYNVLSAIILRVCYAVSGTDIAYGATLGGLKFTKTFFSDDKVRWIQLLCAPSSLHFVPETRTIAFDFAVFQCPCFAPALPCSVLAYGATPVRGTEVGEGGAGELHQQSDHAGEAGAGLAPPPKPHTQPA